MTPYSTLAMAGVTHEELVRHLFPGDYLESAALLVCARVPGPRVRLVVRDLVKVPHDSCRRQKDWIAWPGRFLEEALDIAIDREDSIIALHSHPLGNLAFSKADDKSDLIVMPSLLHGCARSHGSAIMTPNGAVRARMYSPDMTCTPIDLVTVIGHEVRFWWDVDPSTRAPSPLAFTSAMGANLSRQIACVIGVSGTGSIVAEQLSRLGFGRVILIDYDKIEIRNLNRILNSTIAHADASTLKVDVFAKSIGSHRGPDVANPIGKSILTREAVLAASQSDVVFSCVDTLEGRRVADLIASAFLLPLIDVGVAIPIRNSKGDISIADVCGRVDYIQPGRSTLLDRGVYSPESLRAEYLRRVDRNSFEQERDAGYIQGLQDEAPAVITLNMAAAAAAVNEYIARAYPYRVDPNERFARTIFSLMTREEDHYSESLFAATNEVFARGDQEPLLGLPSLATPSS